MILQEVAWERSCAAIASIACLLESAEVSKFCRLRGSSCLVRWFNVPHDEFSVVLLWTGASEKGFTAEERPTLRRAAPLEPENKCAE